MKKLIPFLGVLLLSASLGYGADTKVSDLTADATPTGDDLIMTVNAPATTPANRKVTLTNLMANIPSPSITITDTTDTTTWVLLSQDQTGDIAPKTDGGLPYNAGTGALSPTSITPTNPVGAAYGGTGIANAAGETITIDGGFALALILTAATSVTLPTSGTLITATQATPPFSAVTAATNANALVIGTGGSLGVSGSGTIDATTLLGNTWASPEPIGADVPSTGVFTTLGAGGGGFTVDADGDVVVKTLTTAASATPTYTFHDSDAPGADKEVAKQVAAYIDGADGSENGTLGFYAHEAGTSTLYLLADGKNVINSVLKPMRMSSTTQLQFGDTGTYINQSADGVLNVATDTELKLLINDEDLKFTKTGADGITLGTNTGVTTVTTTLNLVSTGTISGGIPSTTDNNGQTLSAAQQYGYMHWATGAGTTNLVTAVAGMNFCLYSTTAAAVVINPADADVITLNGTALAAGDSITSASGAGDFICLASQSAGNWVTLGRSGTWTDTN